MKRLLIVLLMVAALPAIGHGPMADWWARISTAAVSGWTPGPIGGAVDLDGSAEYFSDSSSTLLNGATQYVIMAWVKAKAASPNWDGIVYSLTADGLFQFGLATAGTGGEPVNRYLYVLKEGGSEGGSVAGTANQYASSLTNWSLLTLQAKVGVAVTSYFNTTSVGTRNIASGISQDRSIKIGEWQYSADRKWNGYIDDVAIFKNRTLSSNEVAELYNNGIGKPVTSLSTGTNGLVRYWKLDDGLSNSSATQALDSVSGTYAPGTSIGSGDWTTGIVPQY